MRSGGLPDVDPGWGDLAVVIRMCSESDDFPCSNRDQVHRLIRNQQVNDSTPFVGSMFAAVYTPSRLAFTTYVSPV